MRFTVRWDGLSLWIQMASCTGGLLGGRQIALPSLRSALMISGGFGTCNVWVQDNELGS